MKFVTVSDFRASKTNIWRRLPSERELIVTDNGKPIALLTPLDGETMEDTLSAFRRARAITAMKQMQEVSLSLGNDKMTSEDVDAAISEARGKVGR
ncbi:MAG: hypothetical protein LBC59_01020 [Chitinispirillales bacterium]|jgi:antitoxin (DNA-binding transcriptional repressor) of toxin-antitoxin stability system|nr:hypothetical protein [Chitinispirillales bacterium]